MDHRDTGHSHAPDRALRADARAPRVSAFAAGIGLRLGVALGAAAALWLAVLWALAK